MLRLGESIRRCGIALLLLLSLCPLQKAHAVIGTLDNVPAATLLYPYFEVDLSNANGKTTVIGVHNTSATAILARVTIWSNAGIPIYDFNIYLTGYDTQSFDMRAVLTGTLPQTGSAGQDPTDVISPKGPLSQDINFASCNGNLPYPPINPAFVTDLQKMLTGQASTSEFPGQCVGTNAGDNVARGYLTVDTVDSCTAAALPTSIPPAQYFSVDSGPGPMTSQNVLLGDYMLINPAQHILTMNNAASIEASPGYSNTGGYSSPGNPQTTTPGNYTFYGRLLGWTAADNREALPSEWAIEGDTGNSSIIAWRDPKVIVSPFSCAAGKPAYAPLGQTGIRFFDRASIYTQIPATPTVSNPTPPPLPNFAPVATQVVPLNSTTMLLPPSKMGLLDMDLNFTGGSPVPPVAPSTAQSLVVVLNANKNVANLSSGVVAVPLKRPPPSTSPAITLTINPNGQLADGSAQDVANVTLVDSSNGTVIAGATVNLSVAFGANLSASSCMTNASGQCSVNITTTTAGSYSVGANALGATASAQAIFNALAPSAAKSTLAIITDNQKANGSAQDVAQVTLEDMNGSFENAVVVTFSAVGPVNFVNNTCTTDANGKCTVGIRSSTPGSYAISVTAPVAIGPVNATFVAP